MSENIYTEWEHTMHKVVDMSDWAQDDKNELFFENMEQKILGNAYSYDAPCV